MQSAKKLIFGEVVREKLLTGLEYAFDAVKHTFGSDNHYTIIEKAFGMPESTTDGYLALESLELKDSALNAGLSIVKEAAKQVNDTCGDGSTLTTLLTYALVKESISYIESGHDPISLKKELEKALESLLSSLKKMTTPLKTEAEILSVATASAGGNGEVGKMLLLALQKVGRNGLVSIDEGKGAETTLEIVEGMKIDRGLISPYFATNEDTLSCEYENARVLITDKKIQTPHEIMLILQSILATREPLLIIAEDFESETLATLIINKVQGRLQVAAIKAPGFGDRQKELLEDLAIFTGAIFISQDKGLDLKEAAINVLGRVAKLKINKEETTLIGGDGLPSRIQERIEALGERAKDASNPFDREKLLDRQAKLGGKVALISVGAKSEFELKSVKQKYSDSLSATKAAIADGILPGGAISLFFAARTLSKQPGFEILRKAAELPARTLIENAGFDGLHILHEIEAKGFPFGFNKLSGKVENLLESGILDAYQILFHALKAAVSAAATTILSETMILEDNSWD